MKNLSKKFTEVSVWRRVKESFPEAGADHKWYVNFRFAYMRQSVGRELVGESWLREHVYLYLDGE